MLVESDILVRQPLAEYLRECGYRVFEAANTTEAASLLGGEDADINVVLADIAAIMEEGGVGFGTWMRSAYPDVDVILAGSAGQAVRKASDLCDNGPDVNKPYDHQLVLDRIKRLSAARPGSA
jgi:DNA-binding response OmpR family regulator